jgi:mannitol 2-dehydrogenase
MLVVKRDGLRIALSSQGLDVGLSVIYGRLMARTSPVALSDDHLAAIARRGVPVPGYDRRALRPRIVHVGVGGFHRAHLAVYAHELAAGGCDWGIAGLGLLERDAEMAAALGAQDCLYTLIEKGAGEPSAAVIGSIVGYLHAPDGDGGAVAELIAAPETAILSLTVTEGGYGEPSAEQLAGGPVPTFDRLAAALAYRRDRSGAPLTVLSCDNLPGNGDAARRAMLAAAERIEPGLAGWIEGHCSFPNSMVDRITPVTAGADREWLLEHTGVSDRWPVVAEPFRQWVMEDDFAGGRPDWDAVGALFTDRIHDWELYKLRLLNAGHSSMAYLGALAGITYVHEAMAVPIVRRFLEELLHTEALPTLAEIPGHPREDYIASVLERFANPGVHDQIARLCIDGSAKFPTFLMPTVASQLEAGGPVELAATALAGWARYLAVTPSEEMAFDSDSKRARAFGAAAVGDALAFLDYDAVFPAAVRGSERFRGAFARAYRRIAADGPRAAMLARPEPEPA